MIYRFLMMRCIVLYFTLYKIVLNCTSISSIRSNKCSVQQFILSSLKLIRNQYRVP